MSILLLIFVSDIFVSVPCLTKLLESQTKTEQACLLSVVESDNSTTSVNLF